MDLADWQDVDGVMVAHSTKMSMGVMKMAENITDVRWNPDMPEGTFVVPELEVPQPVQITRDLGGLRAVHRFVGPYHEISRGIGAVMAWIAENGGQATGGPTLWYPEPMNMEDYNKSVTVIQVPMTMENTPPKGEIRRGDLKPFDFAFVLYEGPPANWFLAAEQVRAWCKENGYRISGPVDATGIPKAMGRLVMLGQPDEAGNITAQVGFPVRKQ